MQIPLVVLSANAGDREFLVDMLLEAVNWHPDREITREVLLAEPRLVQYVTDWPRRGELGVIAVVDGQRIGAAWLGSFGADDPGYGYVADDVPELSIALVASWRRRGIGRLLLRDLAERARSAGFRGISLSVERANPAASLYAAEGYRIVCHDGDADVMTLAL
jgi:GNAT superfamily N-acetyltransferase